MKLKIYSVDIEPDQELSINDETMVHLEIEMNGVRFTLSPGEEVNTVRLHLTQTMSSRLVIKPQAANAVVLGAEQI